MNNNITGIILAGGKSSRMGQNKALLKLNNKRVIEYIYDLLKLFTNKIIISANSNDYDFLDAQIVYDEYKNIGPVSGLYSALKKSDTDINIIVSCDSVFLNKGLIDYMLINSNDYDIVIAKHEKTIEPMIGIYKKKVLNIFEKEIINKNYKPPSIIHKTKYKELEINSSLDFYNEYLFYNINNKTQFNKAVLIIDGFESPI